MPRTPTTGGTLCSHSPLDPGTVLVNSKSSQTNNTFFLDEEGKKKRNSRLTCLGCRFSLYNIKLTLAHLLWRFNLKLGDGTENWTVGQRVYAGWVQPALPVLMEKRA